jgi:Cys-tRNA(Pro)/Cys-tRNA(Cys) deacylase
MKTNAVRILDTLNISYELREYDVDPNDLAAETVAEKINLPPEQVFKTLATLSGNRKVEPVPLKEVQPLTGYIRGGVTALACKKPYPVYVDELAVVFEVISVSAGVRGSQILLAPTDYIRAINGTVGMIAQDKS